MLYHANLCGVKLPEARAVREQTSGPPPPRSLQGGFSRINRGFATIKYNPMAVVTALQLYWNIRNQRAVSLKDIIKLAWRASLPADEWAALEARLASGAIRIPERSMLAAATVKLDVMFSVWQREVLQRRSGYRYLLADSSPIGSTNFFCVREDRILWDKDLALDEVAGIDFQSKHESRQLPLSTLGLGAAGEIHKGMSLSHSLVLESGSSAGFEKYRYEVKGYCSDQGTEAALADSGCALSPACDLSEWGRALHEAKHSGVALVPGSYLLPMCLFIPDHLHVIFGALENAAKSTVGWTAIEGHIRSIARCLRNQSFKDRLIATCVDNPEERRVLQRHTQDLTDWKWEYTGQFLTNIRDTIPILLDRFDLRRFELGCGDRLSKVEGALAKDLAEALAQPNLFFLCDAMRSICRVCDQQATRLEGCRCHEAFLHGSGAWAERVRRYRKHSANCVWKGRRAIEMSMGHADEITANIDGASDRWVQESLAAAPDGARQQLRAMEASLKMSIVERLQSKFGFWRQLPHSLVGIAGCLVGVCSVERARSIARSCLAEYDEAVAAGLDHKLHRVSTHFLGSDSGLRSQVHAFAMGVHGLEAFPQLQMELMGYAMVPCVSRRVEAVHSVIQSTKRKATCQRMPWISAKVRRVDVSKALSDDPFLQWLQQHWNSRDILRKSLRCIFTWDELRNMSGRDLYGWWYQSSVEAQFRNVELRARALEDWTAQAKKNSRPETAAIGDGESLLLSLFKSVCSDCEAWWSAPRGLLEPGLDVALAGGHGGQDMALKPVALPHWSMSELDVATQLCALVAQVDEEAREHRPALAGGTTLLFFKVVASRPERRKVVHASHIAASRSQMSIALFAGTTPRPPSQVMVDPGAQLHANIDLHFVDLLLLLQAMKRWNPVEASESVVRLPRSACTAVESLDNLGQAPLVIFNRRTDLQPRVLDREAGTTANAIVAQLDRARAYAHMDRYVLVTELDTSSPDVLDILEAHKVLVKRASEFGDVEVSLLASGVIHQQLTALDTPTLLLGIPPGGDLAQAPKLQLLALLLREGWAPRPLILGALEPGSVPEFSLNMVIRSKRYYEVLVDSQQVWSRGCPRILHQMPDGYYECLQRYSDLQGLHALSGIEAMGNKVFKRLLAGATLAELTASPTAPELGGALEADDDEPDRLALEDGPTDDYSAVAVPPLALEVAIGPRDANEDLQPVVFGRFTVRFDRWSHSSGILRCYVRCLASSHPACFRYMQVNRMPDRAAILATLIGWAELGDDVDRATHQARSCQPTAARVAQIQAALS